MQLIRLRLPKPHRLFKRVDATQHLAHLLEEGGAGQRVSCQAPLEDAALLWHTIMQC